MKQLRRIVVTWVLEITPEGSPSIATMMFDPSVRVEAKSPAEAEDLIGEAIKDYVVNNPDKHIDLIQYDPTADIWDGKYPNHEIKGLSVYFE